MLNILHFVRNSIQLYKFVCTIPTQNININLRCKPPISRLLEHIWVKAVILFCSYISRQHNDQYITILCIALRHPLVGTQFYDIPVVCSMKRVNSCVQYIGLLSSKNCHYIYHPPLPRHCTKLHTPYCFLESILHQ